MANVKKRTILTFERLDEEPERGTRYRCHRCGRVGVFFSELDRLFRAARKHIQACPSSGPTGIEKMEGTELNSLLP